MKKGVKKRRTSETVMSCRMFFIRLLRGNFRWPSSLPNGAVCSVARQFGHLGVLLRRSASRRKSCAQSR